MKLNQLILFLTFILFLLAGCDSEKDDFPSPSSAKQLFHQVTKNISGVHFNNSVTQTEEMNFFTNQYVLNGGGVAVGDLNNDGLPDLYFTANQVSNKLYLNKGSLKFKDVTEKAKVSGNEFWTTGVTIVDVNADGWNDIYVCHAGNYLNEPQNLKNELFINSGDSESNNGVPTFTEQADKYGLAGFSRTVQATFLDYDNDNDLDVYLVNHPYNFWLPIHIRLEAEKEPYPEDTDRLMRNDGNGKFTDVTKESGVENWAFGLSASMGDLNGDGWMDLYVANDYSEKDEYLLNNQNGTFSKAIDSAFFHISNFSMGSDIADFNNDLMPDVMVLDMMAEDNRRKKINMSAMKPEVFWDNVALGRHYQYMQNTLQLNNGNGTYSEVAELANVSNTDWSWSTIFADLDNDGWKDVFVSNGLALDVRNTDANATLFGTDMLELRRNFQKYLDRMPSEPISNYAFRNKQNLTFENVTKNWGLNFEGFSNGTAIADLDRDGDLDIVLNNINETASVFENLCSNQHYLQIEPVGPNKNPMGVGLTVTLEAQDMQQVQHVSLARGFQSGMESLLHFGLGDELSVEKITATWPDGKQQVISNIPANQLLQVHYNNAARFEKDSNSSQQYFVERNGKLGINFHPDEIDYNDYEQEVLLPHKYSQLGPALAVGDVNGDELEDFILGGASGFSGQLFLQNKSGKFSPSVSQQWSQHKENEEVGMALFDTDNDGDLDLYVASGSNEWPQGDAHYKDRLYLNDGIGKFSYSQAALPELLNSSACVKPFDFDGDGDLDIFVGGRLKPWAYPQPANSVILENTNGIFKDVTAEVAPMLENLGMVTDAEWLDFDNDGNTDLVISGEWMPLTLLEFDGNTFSDATEKAGLSKYVGWWYSVHQLDIDNDGDLDIIAGNLGLNSKYKASIKKPLEVFYADFDENGKGDIVLSYQQNGSTFPVRGKSCSSQQVPSIKNKFSTYESFGAATVRQVYGNQLDNALNYKATWMASSIVENNGDGTFSVIALPNECQLSPVNGILEMDVNKDGISDLVLAGNMLNVEVETCRHDASIGSVLIRSANGKLKVIPWSKSGLDVSGDVKDIAAIKGGLAHSMVVVVRNNQPIKLYSLN